MISYLTSDNLEFPTVDQALKEPNGLLAVGGDLSVKRLMNAYQHGIFPWYNEDQPILWWSPDPRAVLFPKDLHISRSLRRVLNKKDFQITVNKAFHQVIKACAKPRPNQKGTWILPEMVDAYVALHQAGFAHSIEVWKKDKLIGGIYGVAVGKTFSAESMFKQEANASKIALVHLTKNLSYKLIDCQIFNPFLQSMGTIEISRAEYLVHLTKWCYNCP